MQKIYEDLGFEFPVDGVKYWLARRADFGTIYYRWYDAGVGYIRQRSLETKDVDEAKVEFVARVMSGGVGPEERAPEDTLMSVVFGQYHSEWSDNRPNPRNARRPTEYFLDFAGDEVTVKQTTQGLMDRFIRQIHEERGLSVSTIERECSVIHAAIRYAVEKTQEEVEDRGGIRLTWAPKWKCSREYIADLLQLPEPEAREYVAPAKVLAKFIDTIPADTHDHLFRFMVLSIGTWARPSTILDMTPDMRNDRLRVMNLNPKGRRQTKKFRPIVPMARFVEAWLDHWEAVDREKYGDKWCGHYVHYKNRPITRIVKAFEANRVNANTPDLFPYAMRHTMATEAMHWGVEEDDIQRMMGHKKPGSKATKSYLHVRPGYLKKARKFTDWYAMTVEKKLKVRSLLVPAVGSDSGQSQVTGDNVVELKRAAS